MNAGYVEIGYSKFGNLKINSNLKLWKHVKFQEKCRVQQIDNIGPFRFISRILSIYDYSCQH